MKNRDLKDRLFWLATESEIKQSKTTDMYFLNTKAILAKKHIDSRVVMEVYVRELPQHQNWGVLTGTYEVAKLLEGIPVDVWSFPEGSVFLSDAASAMYEPLVTISGVYRDFVEYENPILGFLSSFSSISTRAATFRAVAQEKLLLSFGTRRAHPALAPMVERSCYVAGFDGVSNVLGAELLGLEASGTMPHALIQLVGDQAKAWRMFDQTISKKIPRVALVDTFWDEKAEAIKAFEVLGPKLWGVRIDTPASRRGDFKKIIEEVKWELGIRGGEKVKLIASGRLDEDNIIQLRDLVDGFGVGTAVAYPPVIDFSAKIVEVEEGGRRSFRAKRGGLGGRKAVFRSRTGFHDTVVLEGSKHPKDATPMIKPLLKAGKITGEFEPISQIRSRLMKQLKELATAEPRLSWR
jgi:nicotinate phosphoribosyltransferase